MTDEEANQNTTLWPSKANIVRVVNQWRRIALIALIQMHALRDLVCDACPGDSFVFFCAHLTALLVSSISLIVCLLDAGHCGQQPVTTDVRETDGLDECLSSPFFSFLQRLTLYLGCRYRHMR